MSPRSFPSRSPRQAIAIAIGLAVGGACAQPSGLTPVHGSATMHQAGATTTVSTTNGAGTRHSALDWRSFSVGQGQTVHFAQPDALSLSINRVTGNDPSRISGTLSSNGRLVLVNPAGIAIAPGAVVDTAGFTASTLGMSRADAIAGRLRFAVEDDKGKGKGKDDDDDDGGKGKGKAGKLDVDGRILARNGDVVLVATDLETAKGAVVEAKNGDVVLAAGRTVEITGRGLEGIHMELRAPQDRAVNLGTLRGDSVAIFAGQLRHHGLVQATAATASGGRVLLHALRDVDVHGRVEATKQDTGGTIHVTGEKVDLKGSAVLDASHARGGGEILVGGGSRGADARLDNARHVHVHKGAVLQADATQSGPGGTVIVWSDDKLDFDGTILARGADGGARGRVEVDARGNVKFRGRIDVSSSGSTGGGAGSGSSDSGGAGGGPGGGDAGNGGEAGPEKKGPPPEPLPFVPRQGQPEEVQSSMAVPESESTSYMASATALQEPPDSERKDPYKREVADDGVQCVTR